MRCTEETLIPAALAIMAAVQCVVSPGGSSWVSAITRSATCGPKGGIREGRVLSRRSPSMPSRTKRSCQRHAGFALAGAAHDLDRAEAGCRQQDDACPPDVFLSTVPVRDDRLQMNTTGGAHVDNDILAHRPDSHPARACGIPVRILSSGFIH